MKKQFFLLVLLLLAITIKLEAGDSLKVFRRTGIYAEIGGPGYIHLNGNLEHYFVNGKWTHFGIRAGYGTWGSWGGGGSETIATASGQLGRDNHFGEVQVGSLFYTDSSRDKDLYNHSANVTPVYISPFFSVGYVLRWKHLQLKANVNSRLTINTGLGLIF